jgi:glycosyltransferase involved in cell wall biosynthesis
MHGPALDRVSLVVPCYNLGPVLRGLVFHLWESMRDYQVPVELILVDNGSDDGTGVLIDGLIQEGWPVRKIEVEENWGFGYGALQGLAAATGEYVGFLYPEEIFDAPEIARLCQIALRSPSRRLYKLRRHQPLQSSWRRMAFAIKQFFLEIAFGNVGSGDWNGNCKIFPRLSLETMDLQSKRGWFLDAEVMIHNRRLGLPVFEMNVFASTSLPPSAPATAVVEQEPRTKSASAGL